MVQFHGDANKISHFLRIDCSAYQGDWAWFLPWVEYTQNSLSHSAICLTPFLHAWVPTSLFPWNTNPTQSPAVDKWFQWSKQLCLSHPHQSPPWQTSFAKSLQSCPTQTPVPSTNHNPSLHTYNAHMLLITLHTRNYIGTHTHCKAILKDYWSVCANPFL